MTETERQKKQLFRIYITDTAKNINDSVSNIFGGKILKERFYDMINPKEEETRTPEEIIEKISEKLNRLAG